MERFKTPEKPLRKYTNKVIEIVRDAPTSIQAELDKHKDSQDMNYFAAFNTILSGCSGYIGLAEYNKEIDADIIAKVTEGIADLAKRTKEKYKDMTKEEMDEFLSELIEITDDFRPNIKKMKEAMDIDNLLSNMKREMDKPGRTNGPMPWPESFRSRLTIIKGHLSIAYAKNEIGDEDYENIEKIISNLESTSHNLNNDLQKSEKQELLDELSEINKFL